MNTLNGQNGLEKLAIQKEVVEVPNGYQIDKSGEKFELNGEFFYRGVKINNGKIGVSYINENFEKPKYNGRDVHYARECDTVFGKVTELEIDTQNTPNDTNILVIDENGSEIKLEGIKISGIGETIETAFGKVTKVECIRETNEFGHVYLDSDKNILKYDGKVVENLDETIETTFGKITKVEVEENGKIKVVYLDFQGNTVKYNGNVIEGVYGTVDTVLGEATMVNVSDNRSTEFKQAYLNSEGLPLEVDGKIIRQLDEPNDSPLGKISIAFTYEGKFYLNDEGKFMQLNGKRVSQVSNNGNGFLLNLSDGSIVWLQKNEFESSIQRVESSKAIEEGGSKKIDLKNIIGKGKNALSGIFKKDNK